MRTGLAISSVVHATALLWALLTFTSTPLESMPSDSLPVDIISPTEFSQLTAGSKTAKRQEAPKPLVEKQGEKKQVEDHTAKISEKKEIQATKNEQTPPKPAEKAETKPEPKPEPPKPAEKAETKPEPKPEPKTDPIAEALKKDEAKKKKEEPKKEAQKPVTPPEKKPPTKKPPEFNPQRIAALLDKRDPTRQAATGDTINRTASLGVPSGTAATLSQNELDALRAKLRQNWSVPPLAEKVVIRMVIRLLPDGRLASPPQVLTRGSGASFEAFRDSAVRAVMVSQPFTMLRKETYEVWREIDIDFDERTMFGL
ncbi:cell envelope integrity protein TolA [Pseudorhodoplanes sp.]|uniref:cell envelope integrity protein TolA n=1 Tax=Pseudorhodoplanes sp. TaxID=1934341 RepID=UPI002C89DC05|nr:cell envelope integrity protein TolA [Pseudorhodoplanes sp.]HWV55246.1 cell envelope integrity protein TolA [Pseudorhodoplanes sp.]